MHLHYTQRFLKSQAHRWSFGFFLFTIGHFFFFQSFPIKDWGMVSMYVYIFLFPIGNLFFLFKYLLGAGVFVFL